MVWPCLQPQVQVVEQGPTNFVIYTWLMLLPHECQIKMEDLKVVYFFIV